MTSPLISIVIPVYNRQEDLKRALQSVLNQSFQDFEVLVVDDASPIPIPQKIISDKRVQVLRLSKNQGAAAARNEGIRASRGTYIAFLDSDDTWDPEYLKTQIDCLETLSSSYGGSVTGFRLQSPKKTRFFSPSFPKDQFLYFLGGCFISPGSALILRKDVFKAIGVFNESLRRLEDWEWLLRFSKKYKLHPISEVLVTVYNNESPPSSSQIQENLEKLQSLVLPAIKNQPVAYKNRFLAALELEKASLAKKNKSYFFCFFFILKSFFYDFTHTKNRLTCFKN